MWASAHKALWLVYCLSNVNTEQCFSFTQVKELNHHLETEKASRTDLEMYVAVLNTQKTVLQEDADKLRDQMQESEYPCLIFIDNHEQI